MNKNMSVFMYELTFKSLTLKVKKEEIKNYKYALMECILEQYNNRHCIATKIYKPTKKGTKVRFESIKDSNYAKRSLTDVANELNKLFETISEACN